MLAEIKGKLRHDSSIPAERLEDSLTSAVFGALRYLPRTVLGSVLDQAIGKKFSTKGLADANFRFWPQFPQGTEPDVIIEVDRTMIVIEAKYESGFSANQLAREWLHGSQVARANKLGGPWLLAVTPHPMAPSAIEEALSELNKENLGGFKPNGQDSIKWLPWRRIASVIREFGSSAMPHEKALVDDVLELMKQRGVDSMFEGFEIEDYLLVTSAQRVAANRLYPVIAQLTRELSGSVADDGVVYSNTSPNAIARWGSLHLSNTGFWTNAYFMAPYWSTNWSKPPKELIAGLFAMFNFWLPEIQVGFFFQPKSASARPAWLAKVPELLQEVRSLPLTLNIVSDPDGWTRTEELRPRDEVTEEWLSQVISSGLHLRFHRSLSLQEVTSVAVLRDALLGIRDLVSDRPLMRSLPFESIASYEVAP